MTQVTFQHTLSTWHLLNEESAEEDGSVDGKNEQRGTELVETNWETLEELMTSYREK